MQSSLLQDLNPAQKQAVTFGQGPLLIVAGAGTGKTTVLTRRIAWLILNGLAKTDEILAVTFTDKAAGEMEERVDRLLPYGYVDLWISTFHAFCDRVLKDHAIEIGLPGDYKLLNQTEQWLLVRKNLSRFNLDYYRPLGNPTKFIHALLKHFSRAKDEMVKPIDYLDYVKGLKLNTDNDQSVILNGAKRSEESRAGKESRNPSAVPKDDGMMNIRRLNEVADAYHVYQQLLLENSALDFGDLINYTLELFRKRPHILQKYRAKFKYILVDEFQDTNYAQYELIKLLAAPANNLTVVGDDDQAIYKFRGASISNILQFKNDFAESKEILITENYRSYQNILDTAYKFIQLNNPNRLETQLRVSKELGAKRSGEATVLHIHASDFRAEAKKVVEKILELKNRDVSNFAAQNLETSHFSSWNDYAILVRANDYADVFIRALADAGIPYQFIASRGLYSKPVIMDVLAYLRLLDNYHESSAMYRVLNFVVWGLTPEQIAELTYWANRKARSLYEIVRDCAQGIFSKNRDVSNFAAQNLETSHFSRDDALVTVCQKIVRHLEKHTVQTRNRKSSVVIFSFLEDTDYLKALLGDDTQYGAEAISFLNQFYKKVQAFEETVPDPSVKNFLEAISLELESGEEGSLESDIEAGPEAVKVMTIHSAKGLEFRYVFIANLVDRRFPSVERHEPIELPSALVKEIVSEGDIHLEEERRLFYVAMTRSRDGLFLTSADDYGGVRKKKPSRFLYELGLVQDSRTDKKRSPVIAKQLKTAEAISALTVGRSEIATPRQLSGLAMTSGGSPMPLPTHFSFTQLKAFESCPLQYKFAHILRIPVRGKAVFSFGKSIHATLEKFFKLVQERSRVQEQTLFGNPTHPSLKLRGEERMGYDGGEGGVMPTLDDLLRLYEESWIDDWYESKERREAYCERGKNLLKAFFEANKESLSPPLHVEHPFHLKLKDYMIKGVIDRIDRLPDGTIEIIDYKTGSAKTEETADPDQLLLYQIAAETVLKEKPSKLTYYYVEDGSKVTMLGNEKEKEGFKDKVEKTIEEIKGSDFAAAPSKEKCRHCDFKDICEFKD